MALGAVTLSASRVQPVPRPDFSRPNGEPVVDVAGAVRALWPDAVPPQERVWRKIHSNTAVTGITRDTVRIEARGGPLTGIETVELRLLARAAAEGLERGYEYFEITHLRDRNYASAGRLFRTFCMTRVSGPGPVTRGRSMPAASAPSAPTPSLPKAAMSAPRLRRVAPPPRAPGPILGSPR